MVNRLGNDAGSSMGDGGAVPCNAHQHGLQPSNDPFILSDLDLTMPDTLVTPLLIYELPSHCDVRLLVSAFQNGLNEAVQHLPSLAATISFDRGKKPLQRMTGRNLTLAVRVFETGQHKSYQELADRSFFPGEFDRRLLLPESADQDTEEKPLCIPQLNVIPGGVIMAIGFNHVPLDMASMDLAISLICRCTKASVENAETTAPIPFDYDRRPFAASQRLVSLSRQALLTEVPDYTVLDAGAATTKGSSNSNNSTKVLESGGTVLQGVVYRIEGSTAQRLKISCTPLDGVAYVSTYDCLVGLLWRSVMRIRTARNPSLQDFSSRFLHPVDLRSRPGSGIPKNYFGNAVSVASAGPVPVRELIGPRGLSVAASQIRQSVESTSRASNAAVTALGATMGPTEKLQYRPPGLLQENFLVTSWGGANPTTWDFGIGPPRSVRTWMLPMPGCAIIFPDSGRRQRGSERVYELFVILPEAEQELLSRDEEMRAWFQVA
ncbi:uncharacterized protein BO97DRAFT_407536 [Aspergillus homomorphus CBS 101889]|uniref:Transferase family protein n=1 Tax=Aspergillus homomorphus (strain CBS 101889) TaxID=1450537 RepID=A0A395HQL8_ASPHC|nr:hypothetical protein BO97DRAFT_407536 [Aspergillus homomorphus CBS 101889]RAL09585.1 hypothetical protein BO97DRAFT_407536 [Aspergillus homomorphus CBS 101889]